jgi:uncharacterized membrane protein
MDPTSTGCASVSSVSGMISDASSIEKMAKQVTNNDRASGQIVTASAQWAGPLPDPKSLSAFNAIIPDGAERIMRMTEKEQDHRIEFENSRLRLISEDTKRGHFIGLVISMAAIAAAVYTTLIGAHWSVSVALVGVPVLGIVRAIVGSKTN